MLRDPVVVPLQYYDGTRARSFGFRAVRAAAVSGVVSALLILAFWGWWALSRGRSILHDPQPRVEGRGAQPDLLEMFEAWAGLFIPLWGQLALTLWLMWFAARVVMPLVRHLDNPTGPTGGTEVSSRHTSR